MKLVLVAAIILLVAGLSFWAPRIKVGTPFEGPGYDSELGVTVGEPGAPLVLAVTHVTLERRGRRAFDERIFPVVDDMPNHPGLVGRRVRKELFGDEAWTLSVWTDEASLRGFLAGTVHRSAVLDGSAPIRTMRSARAEISGEQLPVGWALAERLLNEQGRLSAYRAGPEH